MPRAKTATEFQIKVGDNLGAGADLFTKLRDVGVNLMASCCYQIEDQAHLSFVPAEPEKARDAMKEKKLDADSHEVLLVEMPNQAGAFAKVLQEIAVLGIHVRSAYVTPTDSEAGLAVVKTDDNKRVMEELNRQSSESAPDSDSDSE